VTRTYTLIGADGAPYRSASPGTLGGHRRTRVYGRLDCPTALAWLARRPDPPHRVFFADEATAVAAGYRPCGHCLPDRYAAWKTRPRALGFRAPLDAAGLLSFLAQRAIPGVEEVEGSRYRRSLALAHRAAVVELTIAPESVTLALLAGDARDADEAALRCRRLLDLDADAAAIDAALGADPALGPLVAQHPGRRSPGCADPTEMVVRAIANQQVSVAGARTTLGRIAAAHGTPLATPAGGVSRVFPGAAALAELDPERLPMPRSRGRAIVAACAAIAAGELVLAPDGDRAAARAALLALPGVGPWTADYLAMRALGDPDVLPLGDLGVRHGLERLGVDARSADVRWRPWRSYATHLLWAAASGTVGR
jgi:AraC family transcriptional regulator, regulatory protein of adaptative response / DNA-3-methyladenine glycosylase II